MPVGPSTTDRLDGVNEGIGKKAPVRAATTAPITLSGEQTIDTVACVEGDRVLVREQSDLTTNGIYVVSTGEWVRALDCDGNRDIVRGSMVFVTDGSQYLRTMWHAVATNPVEIDDDEITWAQWSGGGGFPNATYWTVDDEGADLPNSRQSVAGTGITLTDGGAGSTMTVAASTNLRTASLNFIIDGGGSTIATGIAGDIQIHFACSIISWSLLGDQSGSIVVDVWKDEIGNFPPDNADSITAAAPPTISTATNATSSTLTGWSTTIAAGSTLRFNVDSVTSLTRCTLALELRKTS